MRLVCFISWKRFAINSSTLRSSLTIRMLSLLVIFLVNFSYDYEPATEFNEEGNGGWLHNIVVFVRFSSHLLFLHKLIPRGASTLGHSKRVNIRRLSPLVSSRLISSSSRFPRFRLTSEMKFYPSVVCYYSLFMCVRI